jgi:hypothetical protein
VFLQARARPNQPRLKQADAQAQKNTLLVHAGVIEQNAFIVHNYSEERVCVSLAIDEPQGCRIERVVADNGSPSKTHLLPIEVEAYSSARVLVDYLPVEVCDGIEYSLTARLYLEGAPNDQVAVYYTTRLPDIQPRRP